MSRLSRYSAPFLFFLCCLGLFSPVKSQTKNIEKASGANVSGRITLDGKGKPGILVVLRTPDPMFAQQYVYKATTDASGNYRITDIPAGSYRVVPLAPVFVISAPEGIASRSGKSLLLSEGENVEGIDFSLTRGAVITGKVTNADNKPAIEERVSIVFAEQPEKGRLSRPEISAAQTDDRGIYRVYGLAPGRYKVAVGQSDNSPFLMPARGRRVYERVFYPGVTDPNEAKVVELEEGAEATNIDIALGDSLAGYSVSGVIVDGETNQPVSNVRFGLRRLSPGAPPMIGTVSLSNGRGEFRFENISPGKYSIVTFQLPVADSRTDPVPLEVVDHDVTGLTVRISRAASISGSIVLEGTSDKRTLAKLSQLRLQVYVRGEGNNNSAQFSSIGADGSFRVAGLQAGMANFALQAVDRSLLTGFVINRVERDGVVSPRGLEIKSSEQIYGVKLFITYGNGTVRGVVKFINGPPPANTSINARLVRSDGTSGPSLHANEVDARGHFLIQGVPAGTYDLRVAAMVPKSRRPPASVQTITVADGVATDVEVVIDLTPPPAPNQ